MNRRFTKPSRSRRAINAVISNMILIAAVITVGFVVLTWAQSQSAIYNNQYSNAIQSSTDQLRERIAFEYIYYNKTSNTLTVYLMNSGTIGNLSIGTVYVNNANYTNPTLRLLGGTQTSSLNTAQEGYFSITLTQSLALGEDYSIIIVTRRGSNFVATFAT